MKAFKKMLAVAAFLATPVVLGAMTSERTPETVAQPAVAIDCRTPIDADAQRHCHRLRALALD